MKQWKTLIIGALCCILFAGCGYGIEQSVFVDEILDSDNCEMRYQVETRVVHRGRNDRVYNFIDLVFSSSKVEEIKKLQYEKAKNLVKCLKQEGQ